jgi:hypothetical protein
MDRKKERDLRNSPNPKMTEQAKNFKNEKRTPNVTCHPCKHVTTIENILGAGTNPFPGMGAVPAPICRS